MTAHRLRAPATSAISVTILLLAGIGLPHVAHAATAPDLKVTKLAVVEGHVAAGASITVHETTKNVGSSKAGPSRTGYWLSKDETKSRKDRSLGDRKVGRLAPNHADTTTSHLTVPSATPAGKWHLIACADAGKAVHEQSEQNNCHATSTSFTVTAPPSDGVSFPQPPHPMKVTPTFGAVSGPFSVTPDAAFTKTVTGPDGTSYALTIPAHALNQTTSVTMTPLTAVAGAPMSSGLVGGVRLQPTGLLLNDDAVLTITPPAAPSRSAATGFRFYDGGVELGMYPLDPAGSDSGSISLDVTAFATYAVGASSDADRSAALAHPPTLVNGQFDNVIAPLVRAQQLGGSGRAASASPLSADAENYYQQVIKPDLAKALDGDANTQTYVTEALAFLHRQAVLGIDNPHDADVVTTILAILQKNVSAEYTSCKNAHSMLDLGRLLANARTYAVLGVGADADNTYTKFSACGQFDVTFSAQTAKHQHYTTDSGETEAFDAAWNLMTTTPLHLSVNSAGTFVGDGLLQHGSSSYSDTNVSACPPDKTRTVRTTITGTTDGRETALLAVDLQARTFYVGPGIPPIAIAQDPQLQIGSASPPQETYTTTTSGCGSGTGSQSSPQWYFTHSIAHVPAPVVPDAPQTGAVLIDRTFTFDNGGAGDITGAHITDTTKVKVTHVPQ